MKRFIHYFRKLKLQKDPLFIETVLPHLDLADNLLIANQEENGSWANDAFITSFALRALYSISTTLKEKSVYKREIGAGISYLKEYVTNLSEHILSVKDLYVELDKTAQVFGNSIYTLWSISPPKRVEGREETIKALKKMVKTTSEYVGALDNMNSICSLLNCYSVLRLDLTDSDSEHLPKLLTFVINKSLSQNVRLLDALLATHTLVDLLNSKLSGTLKETWINSVGKRTDKWKNEDLRNGLNKLALEKTSDVVKENLNDIESVCYGLLILRKMAIEDELQRTLTQRLMDYIPNLKLWRKLFVKRIESEIQIPLFNLSLIIWSLSSSAIARVAMFPTFESKKVLEIMKWHKDLQDKKSRIIENRRYFGILFLVFILTYTVLAFAYFTWPDYRWIFELAGIAIPIASLLLKLFK